MCSIIWKNKVLGFFFFFPISGLKLNSESDLYLLMELYSQYMLS